MREAFCLRCALKFWLACFLLLFIGAELIEWLSHLNFVSDFVGASGTWLILSGMGLAAASNATHLPKLGQRETAKNEMMQKETMQQKQALEEIPLLASKSAGNTSTQNAFAENVMNENTHKKSAKQTARAKPSLSEQSKADSISFKVRFPWH